MGERAIRTPDQRLRVFVSSTLGERADERQAARRHRAAPADPGDEGATLQALRALCEDLTEGHDDPHVVAAPAVVDTAPDA